MKRIVMHCIFAGALLVAVSGMANTILVDFGSDSSYRGTNVVNPDGHGNYWNSVWSGAFNANMIDINGNATTVDLGFDSASGTDYFNGPSGGTEDPSASVYNTSALGNLGVDEAVYDWYSTSTFQLQGLDPTKTYNLTFYGAKKYPVGGDTNTVYTAYTDNSYTTPIDSVTLTVGSMSGAHNQDTVVTLSGLSPSAGNIIYIGFAGEFGNSGYLNAMQIQAIPEPSSLVLLATGALLLVRRLRI